MERIWDGRLVGTFYGYGRDRVYELSDGSRWRQDDGTDEPGCREGPPASLLTRRGSGVIYLAVDGATARVRVALVESPVRDAV